MSRPVVRRRKYAAALSFLLGCPAVGFAQFDPTAYTSLGTLNVSSGTLTINTDTLAMSGAATFTGVAVSQTGGPQVAVFDFSSITIGSGVTVTVTGTRGLALLSDANADIAATISLNGNSSAGAGSGGYIGGGGIAANVPIEGQGPGAGPAGSFVAYGGGHGGNGGTAFSANLGGLSYGNLFTTLQGGSGGSIFKDSGGFSFAGGGGGAFAVVASSSVSVASINANGGSGGTYSGTYGTGGGGGGGILLSGSSVSYSGSLSAAGGTGVGSNAGGTGGGGGRIALSGMSSYTLGDSVSGVALSGGNGSGSSYGSGFAGVVTVDAITTTIGSGKSVTLNGTAVTSVAGSTTQTGATVEAYIRKDLVIDSGGTATLGADNALRRLDVSGSNGTALTVNGTFNTGAYAQEVARLTGTGTVNVDAAGTLTVGANGWSSLFGGSLTGAGGVIVAPSGEWRLAGAINHTGSIHVGLEGRLELRSENVGTQTVASSIGGAGRVRKSTLGTTVLSGINTYTGTTEVISGTLQAGSDTAFGSNSAVDLQVIGTLDVNGKSVAIGSLTSIAAPAVVRLNGGTLTTGGDNTSVVYEGSIAATAGNLVKVGSGTQTLSGTIDHTGTTTVSGGILAVGSAMGTGGTVRVENAGTLQANANIARAIAGAGAGSTIAVGATGISLGDASSFTGFSHQGTLTVGSNAVTLNSAGFAQLGAATTLSGGTITAANGVALGAGANLSGSGSVAAKVGGQAGSTITASGGNLALGANVFGGFVHAGELATGTNTVTITSRNQATLGSVTTLGSGSTGGTLTASNGLFVDFGRAVAGEGTVTIGTTAATGLVNNGTVAGDSATDRITLTGYTKGVGSFEFVTFNGTYSPGLSPALVEVGDVAFGSANDLVMEIGGTARGAEYDALVSTANMGLGGTFTVQFINGYAGQAGDTFDLLDWVTRTGTFSSVVVPTLSEGLGWDMTGLYSSGSLSIVPVPEPASVLGVAAAGLGLAGWVRRRRAAA